MKKTLSLCAVLSLLSACQTTEQLVIVKDGYRFYTARTEDISERICTRSAEINATNKVLKDISNTVGKHITETVVHGITLEENVKEQKGKKFRCKATVKLSEEDFDAAVLPYL